MEADVRAVRGMTPLSDGADGPPQWRPRQSRFAQRPRREKEKHADTAAPYTQNNTKHSGVSLAHSLTVPWSFWVRARLQRAESATFDNNSFFFSFFFTFCLFVRYKSLIATISHDNNNHRTSKHASTSWRSDGSPSCLGGSSHGWVPVKTHRKPVPTSVGGCGLLTCTPTHNNEPKKTQHNNNMVAEQVLRDLSVRRASVMRSRGAQCVSMECADAPDVSNTVRSDDLSNVASRAEALRQCKLGFSTDKMVGDNKVLTASVSTVSIALGIVAGLTTSVGSRRHQQSFI